MKSGIRDFLARHKKALLLALVLYVAALAGLLLLSAGDEEDTGPFRYRIGRAPVARSDLPG